MERMFEEELKAFEKKLGGRIVYSTTNKYCLTLEYDFWLYKTFLKYKALRKDNWYCAIKAEEVLRKKKLLKRFHLYQWYIINRFFKIRKAISESRRTYELSA